MKINGNSEYTGGGSGEGLTPQQMALLNSVPKKVEQVRLTTDGNTIKNNGTVMTFTQIYNLVMDNSKYVYIVMDNNIRFRPSAYDGTAIWFDSSFIEDNDANILRCIINKNNSVKIDQITLVDKDRLKTINGQSIIGSGDITIEGGTGGGGSYDYLDSTKDGALITSVIPARTITDGFNFNCNLINRECLYQTHGGVYAIAYVNNYSHILKLNEYTAKFEDFKQVEGWNSYSYMWEDMTGRLYQANHCLNPETNSFDIQINVPAFDGSNSGCSIKKVGDNIFNIWGDQCYKFNEQTQEFVPYQITLNDGIAAYSNYVISDEGTYYLIGSDVCKVEDNGTSLYFVKVFENVNADYSFLFISGGELYTTSNYTSVLKFIDGEFVEYITNTNVSISPYERHAISGSLAIGFDNALTTIINLGNEELKHTGWSPTSTFAVDLITDQKIGGNKTFTNNMNVPAGIYTSLVYNSESLTLASAKDVHITTNQGGFVKLQEDSTVGGKKIALLDDVPMNSETVYPGVFTEKAADFSIYNTSWTYPQFRTTDNNAYYLDNDGRTLHIMSSDGTWDAVELPVLDEIGALNLISTSSDLYGYNTNGIYKFVDGTFTFYKEYDCGVIIPYQNDIVKYEGNIQHMWDNVREYNGKTLLVYDYSVYELSDELEFTEIKNFSDRGWSNGNFFYHEGYLYLNISGNWHRYNITENTELEQVHIYSKSYECLYWAVGGKTYTIDDNYNIVLTCNKTYSKPDMPDADGTYSLNATKSGDGVSYSWGAPGGSAGGDTLVNGSTRTTGFETTFVDDGSDVSFIINNKTDSDTTYFCVSPTDVYMEAGRDNNNIYNMIGLTPDFINIMSYNENVGGTNLEILPYGVLINNKPIVCADPVPEEDGVYVLKAIRSGGEITYQWELVTE